MSTEARFRHIKDRVSQEELDSAFDQGRSARQRRKGPHQVPYADLRKAEAWQRGYDYELKVQSGQRGVGRPRSDVS